MVHCATRFTCERKEKKLKAIKPVWLSTVALGSRIYSILLQTYIVHHNNIRTALTDHISMGTVYSITPRTLTFVIISFLFFVLLCFRVFRLFFHSCFSFVAAVFSLFFFHALFVLVLFCLPCWKHKKISSHALQMHGNRMLNSHFTLKQRRKNKSPTTIIKLNELHLNETCHGDDYCPANTSSPNHNVHNLSTNETVTLLMCWWCCDDCSPNNQRMKKNGKVLCTSMLENEYDHLYAYACIYSNIEVRTNFPFKTR